MFSRLQQTEVKYYYLESGVCIRVMIGEVADIILMAEACAEGQCVIGLSFLTTSCNGTPCKMIPTETEERFMSKC